MSTIQRKAPPKRKPEVAGTQAGKLDSSAISIAGASKDQYDAAIITPAANPSIASKTFRLMVLKKKTSPEPSAVMNQVNNVAIKAWRTGLKPKKKSIFI
ncbi:hypothetical protein DSCW_48110 [Desulfosarcina widdelii]|uniref:Uncharacterized protein n=1 Tax=Desulfosarcina widdelii TaxID=947919 RepID=A0A5K7ZGC9_9BACT|nr:hypothetical protein DSCW_48110 [Desulfosarcina widdelii]